MRPPILFFIIGFFHVLFCLGKFIWWSENPDLQHLARTPLGVRSSREAGPAYLSVELDSEDVVGVTVVADLRPLLEMVDVHALRHSGAHHNYQTAGEKTLHDVNIRSFCRGQRTVGDQYLVSVFGPHACMSLSNLSWEVCPPPLGKLMTLWWNLLFLCLYWPSAAPLGHLVKYEACRAPHWRGDPERSSTSKVATTRPQLYQEADQSFLREYYTIRVGTHFVEVYWLVYDRNDLK